MMVSFLVRIIIILMIGSIYRIPIEINVWKPRIDGTKSLRFPSFTLFNQLSAMVRVPALELVRTKTNGRDRMAHWPPQ